MIHCAASNGSVDVIKYLIEEAKVGVNTKGVVR